MNTLLETFLSLTYLYVLISLLVSFLGETLTTILRSRELDLKDSIDRILNDQQNKNFGVLLYEHPLINHLRKDEKRFPSYISADTFSKTLVEVIKSEVVLPTLQRTTDGRTIEKKVDYENDFEAFRDAVSKMNRSDLRTELEAFIGNSTTISEVRERIEIWFNEYQTRVSEWFQIKVRRRIFLLSLIVTIVLNFNSIRVVDHLLSHDLVRAAVVEQAEQFVRDNPELVEVEGMSEKEIKKNINDLNSKISSLNLPLGWGCDDKSLEGFEKLKCSIGNAGGNQSINLLTIFGWFISALALSFGAPFWFDLLKKAISFRKET